MGFLGLGEKQGTDYTVQLEKNVFCMGEKAVVKVITDNSQVQKGLESVKVKLNLKISVEATHNGLWDKTKTKSIDYELLSVKGEKVAANEKKEQEIQF